MATELARVKAADEERATVASIVESSHDAIVGMTTDGVVASWNPAAARLYGYPAEDMIGQAVDRIVPPERRDEHVAVLTRITAGEEVPRHLTERLSQDGSVVVVSQTMSPVVDAAGAVIGASCAARRFSELQEARDRFEVRMAALRAEAVAAASRFEVLAQEFREEARQAQDRLDAQVRRERREMSNARDELQSRMSRLGARRSAESAVNRELQQAEDRFEGRVAEQRAEAEDATERFEAQIDGARADNHEAEVRFDALVDVERSGLGVAAGQGGISAGGRPYDLRHAGVSLWLNAGVPAPDVAERAGHSVDVLLSVYAKCIDGDRAVMNRRIERALADEAAEE